MFQKLLFCILVAVLLSGCQNKSNQDADYVSVRLDNSNMWSLLDVKSGKLIFSDEFFAPATNVVNGAFFVQNDDKTFDLYTLENTKNKLNRDSYTFVTNFNPDGFAIVRVKTEPWQIVDTKGQVVATLDKNLGVSTGFGPDGLAMIYNKDNQFGYINTQGQLVIKPRYLNASPFSDGVALVITRQEEGKSFFEVIDKTGNALFKGNSGQYQNLSSFENGYCFAIEGDHVILLDKAGKKVTSVNEGTSLRNLTIHGDKFIYFDKEFYGVKDLTGKILIRAKYPMLQFLGDGNLMAVNSNGKFGVVNTQDEIVVPFEYQELNYLAPNRYLTNSGSVIVLINKDGKEVSDHSFAQIINRSETAQLAAQVAVLSSSNNSKDYSDEPESSFDLSSLSTLDELFESALNRDYDSDKTDFPSVPTSSSSDSMILNMTGAFGKYPVTVNLRIKGNEVSGSYYYTKKGLGYPITVEGFMIDNNKMSITEMVGGQSTGSWNLTLFYGENNQITAEGKMINSKGQDFNVELSGTYNN